MGKEIVEEIEEEEIKSTVIEMQKVYPKMFDLIKSGFCPASFGLPDGHCYDGCNMCWEKALEH